MKRVAIIGGGIAGLTTALHLKDRAKEVPDGLEVLVLEASGRPGGCGVFYSGIGHATRRGRYGNFVAVG